MKLHRFYITGTDLGKQESFVLDDKELIHQLLNVFRFKSGQEIILFNGDGFDYLCQIRVDGHHLHAEVKNKIENNIKPKIEITLCLSLIKKNNFELVVQKATELGVSKIVPIISERSEKKGINEERIRKIMKEATEQSGRDKLPILGTVVSLKNTLSEKSEKVLVFDPIGKPFHEGRACPHISCGVMSFFIGPEGGWSPKEIEMFKQEKIEIFSLGEGILKSETAAIAALAILLL